MKTSNKILLITGLASVVLLLLLIIGTRVLIYTG